MLRMSQVCNVCLNFGDTHPIAIFMPYLLATTKMRTLYRILVGACVVGILGAPSSEPAFTLVAEPALQVTIPITLPNGSAIPIHVTEGDDLWCCTARPSRGPCVAMALLVLPGSGAELLAACPWDCLLHFATFER